MLHLIFLINASETTTSTPETVPHLVPERSRSRSNSSPSIQDVPKTKPDGESEYKTGYQLRWVNGKPEEAFPQFIAAAKKGHEKALWEVATMSMYGIGCPVDIKLAIDCYSVLKDDPQALNNLGALYENFNPDKKDKKGALEQAKVFYQQASEKGLELGKTNLERVETELRSLA